MYMYMGVYMDVCIPITISAPSLKPFFCSYLDMPPNIHTDLKPPSSIATACDCIASSLVGANTSSLGQGALSCVRETPPFAWSNLLALHIFCKPGIKKAKVLPLPVDAIPIVS